MRKTYFYGLILFSIFAICTMQSKLFANTYSNNKFNTTNDVITTYDLTSEPTNIHVQDVEAGRYTTLLWTIDAMGNDHLYVWGSNTYGFLLTGSVDDEQHESWIEITNQFDLLSNGGHVKLISANEISYGIVITDENGLDHIYTWGDNENGQLGIGEVNDSPVTSPQDITHQFDDHYSNGIIVKELQMGLQVSGAIIEDPITHVDSLYTWGNNLSCQIGIGDGTVENNIFVNPVFVPIPLTSEESLKDLTFGPTMASVVVTNEKDKAVNDKLFVWGINVTNNNVGVKSGTYYTPTQVTKETSNGLDENNIHSSDIYKNHNYKINNILIGDVNSTFFLENEIGQTFIFISGFDVLNPNGLVGYASWLDISYQFSAGYDGTSEIIKMDGNYISGSNVSMGVIVKNEQNFSDFYTFGSQISGNMEHPTSTYYGGEEYIINTAYKTHFSEVDNYTSEVSNFAIGKDHTIVILDQLSEENGFQRNTQKIDVMGSNTYGQLGIPGFEFDEANWSHFLYTGGFASMNNFFPSISYFQVDVSMLNESNKFNFSVNVSDKYKYLDSNYMTLSCLYDDSTSTNNLIILDTNFIDESINGDIVTWNYEAINLNPGHYHDFNINFGVTGQGDTSTWNFNFTLN